MMGWQDIYKSKCVTANEAVKHIKSYDRVVLSHASAEAKVIIDAMVENAKAYKDVEIIHLLMMGETKYCEKGMEEHFHHNALFLGKSTRGPYAEHRVDLTPINFSRVPELLATTLKPDVAIVTMSRPDKHGFCSLGAVVDYSRAAVDNAKLVIAELNDKMPRTFGDSMIHISDIDFIVESSRLLPQIPPAKANEIDQMIADHCVKLIDDGSVIQVGIGAVPDAVVTGLKDKKDLGLHSELVGDGLIELIDRGVINNKYKKINRNKSVIAFVMGTQYTYEYVDDNPSFELMPVDYVNNPFIISQNDNMVSINAGVQVDLMGQVCSEAAGLRQLSAIGGQLDFVRGATMSKGGKSILVLASTAQKGKISKIVPFIDEGSAVSVPRHDVDYIVTEYGAVKLRHRTLKDRAKLLISIAHPDFRKELEYEFERRFGCKITD